VALGYCAAVGTLTPPIIDGNFVEIAQSTAGIVILAGVGVCLAGIAVSGLAGMSKERELTDEQKKAAIKEFNFFKGILVATFSGVFSAMFNVGLHFGRPIGDLAAEALKQHDGADLWQNLPVLVVVLWGGFTTNFIWCLILNVKNRSGHEYLALRKDVPLLSNYFFSAVAGTTWYMQFFFYSMGKTKMGEYDFSSWTLHMASIIIFSTLWGVVLREWKGSSKRTHVLIAIGLAVLIGSTVIVGYGNWLKASAGSAVAANS
jgi:L-rhamnose-H+ transport protein